MEKFSGKEKIALVVFGLILLAIIVQVAVKIDPFAPPPLPSRIVPEDELDLGVNLLAEPGIGLSASSRNETSQAVEALRDKNPSTFWHVALDRVGEPAWVTVDFESGGEKAVRALAARARLNFSAQFFRGAKLFGSDDGETWEPVVGLVQWGPPDNARWVRWDFDNDRAFRHYKLLIEDGHECGNFYSIAELAFFE